MGKRPEEIFPQDMANKHLKRWLTSSVIREMQIKTVVRCYFILTSMAKIEKEDSNKCWRGYGETRTLIHCWQERKMVQALWKTAWEFLKWLIIKIPYDPAIPLLGVYLREMKTYVHTETCIHVFTSSLTIIAKGERTKWPLIDEWIFNSVAHLYNIYLTIKRSNDSCYNAMNLDNIMLSERSRSQRATCYRIPCIWNAQNREICGDWKVSDCLGWRGRRRGGWRLGGVAKGMDSKWCTPI